MLRRDTVRWRSSRARTHCGRSARSARTHRSTGGRAARPTRCRIHRSALHVQRVDRSANHAVGKGRLRAGSAMDPQLTSLMGREQFSLPAAEKQPMMLHGLNALTAHHRAACLPYDRMLGAERVAGDAGSVDDVPMPAGRAVQEPRTEVDSRHERYQRSHVERHDRPGPEPDPSRRRNRAGCRRAPWQRS